MPQPPYDPARVEAWCRHVWKRDGTFATPAEEPGAPSTFIHAGILAATGKIHTGHVRTYTVADVCARRARSAGDNVLWALGFEAFGPTPESAAIEHRIPPQDWIEYCTARMRDQLNRLGVSVDWSRCFVTNQPEYYRWTQWVFLRFLERGLVHRDESIGRWCGHCHTDMVAVTDDARCPQCSTSLRPTRVPHWYLRLPIAVLEVEQYRIGDRPISRNRSWGIPVPVIHCPACGQVPVPDHDLPVRLPTNLMPRVESNTLANHPEFTACSCPICHGPGRRDADTLDVDVNAFWKLVPLCVPAEARPEQMFTHPDLRRWLPAAQIVCGTDEAGGWINDRLFFKAAADCGYFPDLADREPVRNILVHATPSSRGRRIGKSLRDRIDPDDAVRRYGADSVRLAILEANPRRIFGWSEATLQGNYKFLSSLWDLVVGFSPSRPSIPRNGAEPDYVGSRRRRFHRRSEAAFHKIEAAYEQQAFHLVVKEVKLLFGRLTPFAAETRRSDGTRLAADDAAFSAVIRRLLHDLEPLAPHICYRLNAHLANDKGATSPAERPVADRSSRTMGYAEISLVK
jgi:leucyl-tRNA synthetase